MLLPSPPHFFEACVCGFFACVTFGAICSVSTLWYRWFPKNRAGLGLGLETYLKAGEYGEAEIKSSWSPFQEPLNAWTSLAYSFFGSMIICTGVTDSFVKGGDAPNSMVADPGFSILYGLSCVYLGVASFLFHASHSEAWRKADGNYKKIIIMDLTKGITIKMYAFTLGRDYLGRVFPFSVHGASTQK